jgi:hypothetical protein
MKSRYTSHSIRSRLVAQPLADQPQWCHDAHAAIIALGVEEQRKREARQRRLRAGYCRLDAADWRRVVKGTRRDVEALSHADPEHRTAYEAVLVRFAQRERIERDRRRREVAR